MDVPEPRAPPRVRLPSVQLKTLVFSVHALVAELYRNVALFVVPAGRAPVADIVILPAALVTLIPVPAVSVAATGACPVDPISICPFVSADASEIDPAFDMSMRFEFRAEPIVGTADHAVPPFPVETSAVPAVGAVVGNVNVYDVMPLGGVSVIPCVGALG